nr:unnamed protein product [Callosobruchus chinensis]
MHNYHEWHVENPHLTRQDRSQYRFKVNMWTGILNGQIIGPFELPDALNGEVYLDFLQNHLSSLLEDVPLNIRREMWFQQDGCPAHYAHSRNNSNVRLATIKTQECDSFKNYEIANSPDMKRQES